MLRTGKTNLKSVGAVIALLCVTTPNGAALSQELPQDAATTLKSLKAVSSDIKGNVELIVPFAAAWDEALAAQIDSETQEALMANYGQLIGEQDQWGSADAKKLIKNNDPALAYFSDPNVQAKFNLAYDHEKTKSTAIAVVPRDKAFAYWAIGKLISAGDQAKSETYWASQREFDPVAVCLWIIMPCMPAPDKPTTLPADLENGGP